LFCLRFLPLIGKFLNDGGKEINTDFNYLILMENKNEGKERGEKEIS